ncbi:MAG: hypothetical protein LJE62_06005 [Silicimonas sp.]|nr:hypothetical protein [Silicimonas sp.]
MPDRRGRKANLESLLPDDRAVWARETWTDREEIAKLPSGAGMLREAAKVLALPDLAVYAALRG